MNLDAFELGENLVLVGAESTELATKELEVDGCEFLLKMKRSVVIHCLI